jgi:predicted hydrocarbon binding protein
VPAHDGRIRLTGYPDCSPAFCRSAGGYCEGALEMMKVPGHIRVEETACQCAGDLACVFDLAWGCRP